MDAKELRIGNYVSVNNNKYYPEIKGIILKTVGISETDNLNRDGRSHSISMNYLNDRDNIVIPAVSQLECFVKPIIITEELLFRLGFEKITGLNPKFRDYEFMYRLYGFHLGSDFLFHYMSGNIGIKYIHQLQNLYFSVDGRNLEFTNMSGV